MTVKPTLSPLLVPCGSAEASITQPDDEQQRIFLRPIVELVTDEGVLHVPTRRIVAFDEGVSEVQGFIVSVRSRPPRVMVEGIGWVAITNFAEALQQWRTL